MSVKIYTLSRGNWPVNIDADTTLSEFGKLIEKTNVKGLLNSYGSYTCFVPTNNAMRSFYQSKGKKSLNDFTSDSLKIIAYDHIIIGHTVMYSNFKIGRLSELTMSNRYISIGFDENFQAFVNKTSMIETKDIKVHNGVIHKIDRVLDPVRTGIAEVISQDSTFSLFYSALLATGLVDSLLRTIDEEYSISASTKKELEDAVNTTITSERHAPISRRYGYTLFMESNTTFNKFGITDFESLKKYASEIYDEMYPQDATNTDLTHRNNSLNRFVAYHIVNKELSYSKLIRDYDTQHQSKVVDLYEYLEPMCPNTLIQIKLDRSSDEANLINTNSITKKSIRISLSNYDNDAINGVYHEIDGILAFDKDIENELSTKRLRFNGASLFSELTNNNMRGRPSDNTIPYRNAIPKGYLQRFEGTEQSVFCYSSPYDKYMNYMGDEIFLTVQSGRLYDFVITTPPIPSGTYEIRFGYQSNGRRGVAQFYVNGIPTGVPVNLNTLGTHPEIGYVLPGNDLSDPMGYENDKMMRNRGYMKGPNSFRGVNESWYSGSSARFNSSNLRKILGTYSFSKASNHKISVKGLSGGQFQIDFIEFVPTSILDREDVN